MGIFWRIVIGFWSSLSTEGQGQLTHDFVKEQVCSYYVAISKVEIGYRYLLRRLEDGSRNADQDIPHPFLTVHYLNVYDLDYIGLNFRATKLPRRFLKYDVYLVTQVGPHLLPEKLGIDDQFNIIRFNGFIEDGHFYGDRLEVKSYNDELEFTTADIPVEDSAKFRNFVTDWLQLTQYLDHPARFKLISNDYTLRNGEVVGNCQSAEIRTFYDHGPSPETKVIYKYWRYVVSMDRTPELKLIRQRTVDYDTVFEDPQAK